MVVASRFCRVWTDGEADLRCLAAIGVDRDDGWGGLAYDPGRRLSFIVAEDAGDENVLWITEVWESQASHQASLETPAAKESFKGADTLIVGYGKVAETKPVAGPSGPLHGEV